jgi:hypothetical protein
MAPTRPRRDSGEASERRSDVTVISTDPIRLAPPSIRRAGFQAPCVTELGRRWDPIQGREVFLPPSTAAGPAAAGRSTTHGSPRA